MSRRPIQRPRAVRAAAVAGVTASAVETALAVVIVSVAVTASAVEIVLVAVTGSAVEIASAAATGLGNKGVEVDRIELI